MTRTTIQLAPPTRPAVHASTAASALRPRPAWALVVLAAFALGGCGGDDEGVSGKSKADANGNLVDGAIRGQDGSIGDGAGTSDGGVNDDAAGGDGVGADAGSADTASSDTGPAPKTPCTNNTVCKSDEFCALYYNGVKNYEGDGTPPKLPGWANVCEGDGTGVVQEGGTCDPIAGDSDTTLKPCVNASACMQGTCTALCETDAHCPAGSSCGVTEYGQKLPKKAGGEATAWLPVDICVPLPEPGATCDKNAECKAGEVCRPWVKRTSGGFTKSGRCVTPEAGKQSFDGPCGANAKAAGLGKMCASTLCLYQTSATAPGVCTDTCSAAADCPKTLTYNGNSFPTVCDSLLANHAGTETSDDDVYIPHCVAVNQKSSLKDCATTRACEGTEACRAYAIAGGPDTKATVEYRCIQLTTTTLPGGPQLDDGATCDLFSADNSCKGGYCLPGADGKGYCSRLCLETKACGGGTTCDTGFALIPRADASKAAVTGLCVK